MHRRFHIISKPGQFRNRSLANRIRAFASEVSGRRIARSAIGFYVTVRAFKGLT